MESAGIISRGESPYGAWTIFVDKPGEERVYRVVHDFQSANNDTVKPAYLCHNVDVNLNDISIGKPTCYSKLEAKNGYWAVPIRPGDGWLTGFIAPSGWYCYRRMAQPGFGVCTNDICQVR